MSEAKGASLTMLPCHRGLFCIWVRCCVVCFSLFHKGSRCTDLCHEIYGIGILGSFTQKNPHPMLIPDLATKRGIGRRQARRIRNGLDESEAGMKKKHCNLCGADCHTYKKCPQLSVPIAAAEAGPSGNPTDGSAPPTRIRRM